MTPNEFESILDDCLARLSTGESLDDCLARYPEYFAALRTLLVLAVEARKLPRPVGLPADVQASREKMLAALRAQFKSTVTPISSKGLARYTGQIRKILDFGKAVNMRFA